MKTATFMRFFAPLALLGLLSGCGTLSKNECLSADWEDIGVRDGANGRPEEYLIHHASACSKVGVAPDRVRWQAGRERGLDRFCIPERAYRIGENGGSFDVATCQRYDEQRLFSAYQKGREVNRWAGRLSSIDSEIKSIHTKLDEDKELKRKEREQLAYRLGQLTYERVDAERAYEDARYRAQDL